MADVRCRRCGLATFSVAYWSSVEYCRPAESRPALSDGMPRAIARQPRLLAGQQPTQPGRWTAAKAASRPSLSGHALSRRATAQLDPAHDSVSSPR